MVWIKRLLLLFILLILLGVAGGGALLFALSSDLPKLITVNDYEPRLVSEVYARGGEKIGEFYREKRTLTPFNQIPKHLVQAFLAAEDDQFYQHRGVNFMAIARAAFANLKAGKNAQGGSTITQQVAKTLLLTPEKTFTRKFKDMLLAMQMEKNLKKDDILYLYLNQIYFGQGAYGVATASEVYFQKKVQDITLAEAAILAGLPQAPSRYSPVSNPRAAKERQLYVLRRMAEVGFIKPEEAEAASKLPITVNMRRNFADAAPFFVETLRQLLVQRLGESTVLDRGIKVYTGLYYKKQMVAQEAVQARLRELDKRQGYRGPLGNVQKVDEMAEFLLKVRNNLLDEMNITRVISPDGSVIEKGPLNLNRANESKNGKPVPNLPQYVKKDQTVQAIVTKVDDNLGVVYVRFAEAQGIIDIDDMKWARKPNPQLPNDGEIKKPSDALKFGDLILVKVLGEKFNSSKADKRYAEFKKKTKVKGAPPVPAEPPPKFDEYAQVALEQDPLVEGALLSIDQKSEEIIAMVGGLDFNKNQFNRALQAARQTGSSFKVFVYAAALDKGYTPATPIMDAPVVYEEKVGKEGQGSMDEIKKWKPDNHSKKFGGDILFRNALIQSLNVPTVKIIEDVGVEWSAEYARRLGVFSPLNMDFSMGLGSSSLTLFEMTKAFSQIGRMGRRTRPLLIHKVLDKSGQTIAADITLDERFNKELKPLEESFEDKRKNYLENLATATAGGAPPADVKKQKMPPIYFDDADQLIKPQTAFLITDILQAAIFESGGTGGAARALGRPAAGKTGTTSDYVDAWFMGFTPQIATGVWVGYDEEKSLGQGEVGGRAALPAWLDYMKAAHENEPELSFAPPPGVVFVNIDKETGQLASAQTRTVVRQAFVEGTEPTREKQQRSREADTDFLKEELAQ